MVFGSFAWLVTIEKCLRSRKVFSRTVRALLHVWQTEETANAHQDQQQEESSKPTKQAKKKNSTHVGLCRGKSRSIQTPILFSTLLTTTPRCSRRPSLQAPDSPYYKSSPFALLCPKYPNVGTCAWYCTWARDQGPGCQNKGVFWIVNLR